MGANPQRFKASTMLLLDPAQGPETAGVSGSDMM